MAFTDAEKVDLRRFAGFPPLGADGVASTTQAAAFETLLNSFSPEEEASIRTYLGRLLSLETTYFSALETVDTKKAAVWERNPNALVDAQAGLNAWRAQLVALLGIEMGPWGYIGPPLPAIFTV